MKANAILSTAGGFLKGSQGLRLNSKGRLVSNATTLRHEEGKVYDAALLEVARMRLNGVEDLRRAGLFKPLGGLGTVISMYERVGDMTGANIDMDGRTESEGDRVTFDEVGVPIPIIHKGFGLSERTLLASRQRGESLDTTQLRLTGKIVMEGIEDMLFNGVPNFTVAGLNIYGYTTHPNRNTYALTANWVTGAGADIVTDVKAMIQKMLDDKKYGPYTLYVAKNIMVNLQSDYSAAKGDNTIVKRILAFEDIKAVRSSDTLAAGQVLLIQMDSETVDLAVAQDIRQLQWSQHPLETDFMIFAAMAPRIKADRDGNCGIVHGS
jgi:uncharacterized linocin/CFP29 family protein